MNGANVKQLYESLGARGFYDKITTCLQEGKTNPSSESALKYEDIDLKEMFIGIFGERAFMKMGEKYLQKQGDSTNVSLCQYGHPGTDAEYKRLDEGQKWYSDPGQILREDSGDAVDVSGFSAITGQIAYNYINKGWQNSEMVGDRLFTNRPTEFSGQKIPWLSNIFGPYAGDLDIHPGMDYPETTFGGRYIQTPRTIKKGGILSISLEFMLFDRTGQAGSMGLTKLGEAIRYQKEYAQLRVFMGYQPIGPGTTMTVATAAPWAYALGSGTGSPTYYGTYQTSGSSWVNALSSTPLVDWTSINQAIYLRSKIIDPDSGRPIALGTGKDLFVMPQQLMIAKRIINATNTQTIYPGYSASSPAAPGNVKLDSANPITWNLDLMTSPIAYNLLTNATANPANVGSSTLTSTQINAFWWYGDFKEAFSYFEIFPFRAEQAIAGNIREFQADIKLRFKCSEMGIPAVWDPRNVQFFYNT